MAKRVKLNYGEGNADSRYKAPRLPFCKMMATGDKLNYWAVPATGGRDAGRALAVPYLKHLCEIADWDTTPLLSYVVSDMAKKLAAAEGAEARQEIHDQLIGFFEAICRATREAITAAPPIRKKFLKLSEREVAENLNAAFNGGGS
jgi:hypothetical protein